MERDDTLRLTCFLALDALRARFGDDLPYADALKPGFVFEGRRIPSRSLQQGIYRSREQRGPAALSLMTAFSSPYEADEATDDGFWYAYRAGAIDQADNRALKAACDLRVPIVYFVGTASGWFRALYPCYVVEDDHLARRVRITVGTMRLRDPMPLESEIERRYAVREARVRLHQGRFRGAVLPAYRDRCAICTLREKRLLDAAHIISDGDPLGLAEVCNGISLCSIHHRAYDEDLVGIDPDYRVHVARRLLDDEDGPMLELLKGFHGGKLALPRHQTHRPDRERLDARFMNFQRA